MQGSEKYNVIIPMAGQGKRLRPYTEDKPKALVEINGKSILEWQLAGLDHKRVQRVILVVGYREDIVDEFVANKSFPFDIEIVRNEIYEQTHCMYSIWSALRKFPGAFIHINCDLMYQAGVFEKLTSHPSDNTVVIKTKNEHKTDLQQVRFDSEGKIVEWALILKRGHDGEVVGPVKVSHSGYEVIQAYLQSLNTTEISKLPCYTCYSKLIDKVNFFVYDIADHNWAEIDTPEDLTLASKRWGQNFRNQVSL